MVIDPGYSGKPETLYKGEVLGYDGTLKVHTKILLNEFWHTISSFGAAQGLDEVAMHVLNEDGKRVYNGFL